MERMEGDSDTPPRSPDSGGGLSSWLKKKFGRNKKVELTQEERDKAIEESIEQFASQISSEENVLEEDEREMIHGVVELGETAVKEIMIPRINMVGISAAMNITEVIDIVKKSGHSRIPLYGESLDDIKGILYAKDLLSFVFENKDPNLVSIARKPYFIPENLKIDDLLREMRKKRLHIAIVVDEYGGTSGLVTMEDIIEEIVGEIEDEYDTEPPPIIEISANTYMVDGIVTISDLNEQLDLGIPEEEFETVGGLIYDLVGSLPEKGRTVIYHSLKFVVHRVEGQRIVKVKLSIVKKNSPAENE
ncbi:MAG: hemolysin family protein [candidate division Zixibacteria bacterium]